jgi:hypothetical protein
LLLIHTAIQKTQRSLFICQACCPEFSATIAAIRWRKISDQLPIMISPPYKPYRIQSLLMERAEDADRLQPYRSVVPRFTTFLSCKIYRLGNQHQREEAKNHVHLGGQRKTLNNNRERVLFSIEFWWD